jgi:hypothetical protein
MTRVQMVRQRGVEHHDPAGQDYAAACHDDQRHPPFAAQLGVVEVRVNWIRGGLVEFGERPGRS